jgi:hypothetical protein
MSNDEKLPWWEQPGAPGENRTKEQYEATIALLKAPNPNRKTDTRNRAERLLNALVDHIAATLEQPTDMRAWDHLLVYCPPDALERRFLALSKTE